MSRQQEAEQAQKAVLDSIPPKWKLASSFDARTGMTFIETARNCAILSSAQIEITELTATELLARLAAGQLTSFEVTEAFCARAAIAHQLTNCLTAYFSETALETAAALDAHLRSTGQPVGPLHGLPVSIKDQYNVKGFPTTLGFLSWKDKTAEEDSIMVKNLRDAGAVLYVKTTMPQTGMALETNSSLWGRTLNAYNPKLGSGGSSGGEAVLIAMRGSPIGPASDIGGSIRVPAAFNGLYAIRPSADRIPKQGMPSSATGQISIRVSCGPVCHSIADVKMFTKIIANHPLKYHDPLVVPMPWREVSTPTRKLSFGLLEWDGVCMPHPPILRALRETKEKLVAAGHEVTPIKLPLDCWAVGLTTWKLYFQTGAEEIKTNLAAAGEEMLPSLSYHLDVFDIKPLAAKEIYALNTLQASYKVQMAQFWRETANWTSTGLPIDGIICAVHPSLSYPHDFPCWWGYSSLFNILDYPSTVVPIKDMKVSAARDPKDESYKPLQNPFDQATYDMYDPKLFSTQPTCLQIVGRPYEDEELVAATEVVDSILNAASDDTA